ncbi:MAG: dephospho-CoA kinase [Chloroflexi bacterium RBG_13_57_8]|nr:MAG: dephospho-CoA kinase [Chloroflexi bacterium RBG_13_57_8]
MRVIGLTGGIGSGKSTVAGFLAELGAAVIDLDRVGHDVLKSSSAAFGQVVKEFGEEIMNKSGGIDRARLAEIVFKDPEALACLNRITHPAIDKVVDEKIGEYRRQGVKVVVLEAAAMLEAGKSGQADEIWVTTAPEATVLERIGKRSGYTEEESRARLRSQLSREERLKHADVVIDTDCSLDELKNKVKAEWRKLMSRGG